MSRAERVIQCGACGCEFKPGDEFVHVYNEDGQGRWRCANEKTCLERIARERDRYREWVQVAQAELDAVIDGTAVSKTAHVRAALSALDRAMGHD